MTTEPQPSDRSPQPHVMECGCIITFDDPEPFASFKPCSEVHRTVAMMVREPGSMIVIGPVRR